MTDPRAPKKRIPVLLTRSVWPFLYTVRDNTLMQVVFDASAPKMEDAAVSASPAPKKRKIAAILRKRQVTPRG